MTKIMKNRPTQKQIAEQLGLSAATVSLALRDNPVVAKSTRELVHQAMRDTGYVRNLAAASLRTGRSNIVGVSVQSVAHSAFGDLLVAIERAFEDSGTVILINNHDDDVEKLDRFISTLATYGADALLVAPPSDTPLSVMERVGKHGMQVLYLGSDVEEDAESDLVGLDNIAAGAMAARHLIEAGFDRLCLVGGRVDSSISRARMEGVKGALAEAGMSWSDDLWIPCAADVGEAVAALQSALARDPAPTGIVCAGDTVLRVADGVVQDSGRIAGGDIGLVGLGTERGAEVSRSSLAMVCGDTRMIGRLGAETILARLETPDMEPRRVILDPKLVPGGMIAVR